MTGPASRPRIEKLDASHSPKDFDCGQENLNQFLKRYALINQKANSVQTYLGLKGDEIIGYYSLVVGSVAYEGAASRLTKGLPRHPVPVMLLARLAVDLNWQGKGVGAGLLRDAMLRTLQAADIAGIRAFIVHAKNDRGRAFYEHFDFRPSPTDDYHLYLLMKDIKQAIAP